MVALTRPPANTYRPPLLCERQDGQRAPVKPRQGFGLAMVLVCRRMVGVPGHHSRRRPNGNNCSDVIYSARAYLVAGRVNVETEIGSGLLTSISLLRDAMNVASGPGSKALRVGRPPAARPFSTPQRADERSTLQYRPVSFSHTTPPGTGRRLRIRSTERGETASGFYPDQRL